MESGEIIEIEVAEDPTQELLRGINFLLPQLSGSAQPLKLVELEAILSDESVNLLVASEKISGAIVGTLTLVVFRIPTGVRAWIEDVVTDSSIRGRGIAKKMVSESI
jgi:GNAT superfamily N-acetyltransferase